MAVETKAQERANEPVGDFGAPGSPRPEGYFSHPRRMARLTALVALVALSAVWWGGHVWYRKNLLTERRGEVLAELDPYGNALIVQNRLRFALLRALRAFVETHYSSRTFAADFEIFGRGLVEGLPGIRTLTIAPRGVQRFVYPLTGNETVVGHDLMRDPRPDVRADVARAIESRKPVVSGPYELRQGGVGVVARLAIHRGEDFWGLATVDVDVSLLLAETGITKTGKLRMALRDEQGRVFFGEPAVFESDPLIHRIDLPDGHWDLSAIPDKGWNAAIERNLAIFDGLALAILLLLTGLVAMLVDRDARLALLVQERTRGLNAELEQRKRIETQLRRIEERYRTLVELNPDAVMVFFHKAIAYVNKAALRLFGATKPEEILGRSAFDFVHPDSKAEAQARYQQALETGERNPPALQRTLRLDGSIVHVETVAAPLAWKGGTAIQVIMRDLTELRKAESWLRGLIEATQDAVISINRQARIVMFNPAAERIFGYTRAEVEGKKVNMLMAEPYATEHDDYITRYETTGEAHVIGRIRTVEGRRKNGETFPIELSVTQIAAGEDVNYFAFLRDISEKAKLQRELVENERLAAIGATSAKFAHEIGNPLNGMYMSAQLLERRLAQQGGLSDERVASTFRTIVKEMERLNMLLGEFRSLYHQERYNFRPTSLAALTADILNLERPNCISRGIHIEQSVSTDVPLVIADSDKLKQVLLNLCKNAVEAMPEGGTLTVRAARNSKEATIEVSDTGVGIPEGIDIWEPFTTTKTSGTGLGLVIVRQIIAGHHGTISYTSDRGRGTTFRLTLPLDLASGLDGLLKK